MMNTRYWCRWLGLLVVLVLTGCGRGYAPVTDAGSASMQRPPERTSARSTAPVRAPVPDSGYHVVKRGDTLYAIAWRYGFDYRDVARWNNVHPPYIIYPGDRIRLRAPSKPVQSSPAVATRTNASPPRRPSPPLSQAPSDSGKRSVTVPSPPLPRPGRSPPIDPAAASTHGSKATPPLNTDAPVAKRSAAADQAAAAKVLADGPITWQWPTQGSLLRVESPTAEKGIKLSGRMGQPIQAAASGQVVYSGSGLIGYGKLIIIKHNDTYLSAYAHNSELLVKEGDSVTSGQQIATMGKGADGRAALHFEIRRNGQPIDPLKHLPARQG